MTDFEGKDAMTAEVKPTDKHKQKRYKRILRDVSIWGTIAVLCSVVGFNCGRFGGRSGGGSASTASVTETPDVELPIALLSAEQILKAMIAVTGIESADNPDDPADDLILSTYAQRSGSLPAGQDLRLMTAPMMVSVANLASAVCAKMVDREITVPDGNAGVRLFFREVAFSQGPAAITDEAARLAATRMARNFWRRDITAAELTLIADTMRGEFLTGVNGSASAETRAFALGMCTAMLSSLDTIVY